jgi:hypothetical protein
MPPQNSGPLKHVARCSRNDCWTAPAKIEVSGLTTDLGDHDGNHDWVVLQNVIEVGKFTNYGCEYN